MNAKNEKVWWLCQCDDSVLGSESSKGTSPADPDGAESRAKVRCLSGSRANAGQQVGLGRIPQDVQEGLVGPPLFSSGMSFRPCKRPQVPGLLMCSETLRREAPYGCNSQSRALGVDWGASRCESPEDNGHPWFAAGSSQVITQSSCAMDLVLLRHSSLVFLEVETGLP